MSQMMQIGLILSALVIQVFQVLARRGALDALQKESARHWAEMEALRTERAQAQAALMASAEECSRLRGVVASLFHRQTHEIPQPPWDKTAAQDVFGRSGPPPIPPGARRSGA